MAVWRRSAAWLRDWRHAPLVPEGPRYGGALRRSWSDDEPRDVLAGDGEVPVQVGGATGEVAGQTAADEIAVGAERFGARDLGRVGVSRCRAGLPGSDRRPALVRLALVDDARIVGEEADDRIDV